MAQARAFETDFWKDAKLRKVWDEIVPGEPRKTIPYTLTKEAIELYCRSVGETHPLYFDEAYARLESEVAEAGGLLTAFRPEGVEWPVTRPPASLLTRGCTRPCPTS